MPRSAIPNAVRASIVDEGSVSKDQNCPRDFSSLHGAKRVVDLVESGTATDHIVEVQSSLPVQIKIPGHVELEAIGPHVTTLNTLLNEKVASGEFELDPGREGTDDGGEPPRSQRIETLLAHLFVANGVKGKIYPTVAESFDLFHRIDLCL
jgi:hypothetical protein